MRMEVDGLLFEVTPAVYEPSDDSFLLAKYSEKLKGTILDVGCGCGIHAIVNAKKNPENSVLGIDINRAAIACAAYNASLNRIKNISFIPSNLFEKVGERHFNGIIFNPPYLPTEKHERIGSGLNDAFDGGKDGRLILDRFLLNFDRYLSEGGTLLLMQSSLNDMEKTVSALEEKAFSVTIRDRMEFFFEKLYVLEARRL